MAKGFLLIIIFQSAVRNLTQKQQCYSNHPSMQPIANKMTSLAKKNKTVIFATLVTLALTLTIQMFVQPARFLPQPAFLCLQLLAMVTAMIIQLLFCICKAVNRNTAPSNKLFYSLIVIFYNATVCGFVHEEASFKSKVSGENRGSESPCTVAILLETIVFTLYVMVRSYFIFRSDKLNAVDSSRSGTF